MAPQTRLTKAVVVMVVLLLSALSGCLGGDGGQEGFVNGGTSASDADPNSGGPVNPGDPSDDPDGTKNQTETRVKIDPNRTFVGGAHNHDWWAGESQIVIHDQDLPMPPGNACLGADPTFSCSTAAPDGAKFVRFTSDSDPASRPNIVYPGTGKMEIKITHGQLLRPYYVAVQGPGGFSFAKTRLLVDKTPITLTLDGLVENNTDPPHFRTSSYVFRLEKGPDVSVYTGPVHWQVTVYRDLNRDLPIDPPHPDFWAGATSKVLWEATVPINGCTHIGNPATATPVAAGTCTGAAAPYISLPVNSTITIGAGKLRVEQAWTNSDPVPTKLRLSYCAPGAVSCISTGAEYLPAKIVEDASNKRVYEIETRPDQWDSPYVTKTAWTFRWNFDNQDGMGTGRMTGSISWKFELFKLE